MAGTQGFSCLCTTSAATQYTVCNASRGRNVNEQKMLEQLPEIVGA